MSIAYLAIGDELLRGETREGNGAVLLDQLLARGLRLAETRTLPDDLEGLVAALHDLARRHALIVCSGGLGPTEDDLTRAAVARALGVGLVRDVELLAGIAERFAHLGRSMHPTNARQADRPAGTAPLRNDHGSAPGFAARLGAGVVVCLPGVPREFEGMLRDHLDALLRDTGLATVARREVTLRVFGIGESDLQGLLDELPGWGAATMRSLPTWPELRLKLAERDDPAAFDALVTAVRRALGWRCYGDGDADSHAAAVLRALRARNATLAIAESCTGGLIGHLLTEVPGASAALLADAVCYADAAKAALAGVDADLIADHGAVSEAVALAMAKGIRERTGAAYGLATTGIAGPTGGTPAKPVGTVWLALAGPDGARAWRYGFPGLDRSKFKCLVAHMALAAVLRAASGPDPA
ncbi:MAG: CinA family nicotinamide mononucleotide deamidase-related protein [Myxococcales bacterium]|nr:CinA family nicotinamide mononucleotide deamidase-related protein [Myxococcales bacterium]